MKTPRPVPAHLQHRAFSLAEAREAGITPRMLQHDRFVEVHPRVYRLRDVVLDPLGRADAARLALPPDARSSHGTRLLELGHELTDQRVQHFTVGRDLHLAIDGIMLHRTVRMPPSDDRGVCAEAAFVGLAATERLVDLVAIGDWLLRGGHMTRASLVELVRSDWWRPGAGEALTVLEHLDPRSRSPKESVTRVVLTFGGLPVPEVNAEVRDVDGSLLGIGDLVYRLWRLLVEYEGRQHALDAAQFARDIDRYGSLRGAGWDYLQVTQRHLDRPRSLVLRVHAALVRRGYTGPPPVFDERWASLFRAPRPTEVRRSA